MPLDTVLITGGGGYVGSALVPALLKNNWRVRVLDLFLYGQDVLHPHPNLTCIKGDIRDRELVVQSLKDCQACIHLACISNDPSFELNPTLGKSINLDAFHNILYALTVCKPERFIYASSSSIYGVQDQPEVVEDTLPLPLTDYSKFKLECEYQLQNAKLPDEVAWTIIRPATVCGYARRLRLDLVVNILTAHALINNRIRVFGGSQLRPNIVIDDMVRAYEALLKAPRELIDREAFNVGYDNLSLDEISNLVVKTLEVTSVSIEHVPTNDLRSYHINSEKIDRVMGFKPKYTLEEGVRSLKEAFEKKSIHDGLNNPLYHNIKRMQAVNLV